MEKENIKRVRLLRIWEILKQESDEDHPMSSLVLLDKLKDGGIECDRRTLYSDIKVLNDFGYEILCNRKTTNEYYVVDRDFDIPEIHILMDAVQAASFITERKTEDLVDKIANLAGSQRAEVMKQNIVKFNTTKGSNEHIYYSVNELATAINNRKKVTFQYFDYDEKHKKVYRKEGLNYLVNPVATVFSDDKYYLVCYDDKHGNLASYRVDRMENVTITAEDINETKESKKFDVGRHRTQAFGMYAGETETVRFEADKSILDPIFDAFGEDVKIISIGDNKVTFSAEVQLSPMFFSWCSTFGKKLKISGPDKIIKEFVTFMTDSLELYKKD
jgi:predicted DNA-binding transcriptional regulator YafY